MGDLLDTILEELKQEARLKRDTEAKKRYDAERHRALVAAKIKLTDAVGELLRRNPRDQNGICIFCGSIVHGRHKRGCVWLELYLTYKTYKNKFIAGRKNGSKKASPKKRTSVPS